METKVCSKCGVEKPLTDFTKNKCCKDGHSNYCKTCHRLQHREYRQNNQERYKAWDKNRDVLFREKFIAFKSQYKCIECGESDIDCLDFHHINPEDKKYCIAKIGQNHVSMDTVLVEINKCVCLCANCHRKFHAKNWKIIDKQVVK